MFESKALKGFPALTISLAVAYLAAFLGSFATAPAIDTWYASLEKPDLAPPDLVFGPAWTILYTLMALAAWRVYRADGAGMRLALVTYGAHLAVNVFWSFAFFALRSPEFGFTVIIVLLVLILATAWQFFRIDRIAGLLFLPYIAWVSFATYLNFAIMRLN